MSNKQNRHEIMPVFIRLTKLAVVTALVFCSMWIAGIPPSIDKSDSPEENLTTAIIAASEPSEPELEVESEPENATVELYPVGKLCVSQERKVYFSGEMILEIPRLGLICPVIDGTEPQSLSQGVGLFDYAQLPGSYNSNTSLAAHRDIYGQEFYYIDTLTENDMIYLRYNGKRYTYLYQKTFITNSADWNPIRVKDFACITLQSCDPIYISANRIFVEGKLIRIEDEEL